MIIRAFLYSAVLLSATLAKGQFLLDCSCLSTQSVLITNACQAVVPDLCLFTNCYRTTIVPPPTLTCSQSPPAGTPVGPGTYTITLTISDPFGTAQSCALPFTVNAPAGCGFSLLCASNKTVECGTQWNFDPPTWTNACIPPPGTPSNGVMVAVLSTVTNGTCPMVITRTWQAVDDCMHVATCIQKVTVVDTKPPLLDCRCLTNNAALPPIPLIVTNCSGTIPNFCQYALLCSADACGPLTCTQSPPAGTIVGPGVYPLTVTVLDCASNHVSCMLNYTVVAPTPPGPFAVSCFPNKTVECGTTWSFNPPNNMTVVNYCCPPLGVPGNGVTISVVSTTTNGTCPMVITRTWRAVDACGNVAQCSQVVTVVDTTPPVINCNCIRDLARDVLRTNDCFHGIVPNLCIYTTCVNDTCGPLSCSQTPPAGTVVGVGVHPITITISDCAGNTASCTVPFRVDPLLQTNVWNTGMGAGNVPLPANSPDPNYVLVSAPPGGCNGPAQVLNPAFIPSPPWVANGPNSQWIGAGPTVDCQPGVYRYRLCFDLPCTNGITVLGQWAADDAATMFLNGQPTGLTIPSPQFPNLPAYGWFPVALSNGFVCGMNCLDFYVTNANIGINPTGFRAELTNIVDTCCMCTSACVLTITCPPNQTNYTCGVNAAVTYPAPAASSTCGPVTNLVCTPPSGAIFPLGPTTVTCTAIAAGQTNSCTFTVTVIRHTNPWTVQCPPINLSVTGCPPVMPNLSNLVTIITNCPLACPIIVTQQIVAGTILTPGPHVVIIRSCDCNGVCFDCDVIVNAVPSPNCCTTTPVFTLNSGANSSGVLPGGAQDPQFQTGPPSFGSPSPFVPVAIHPLWMPNTAVSKWVSPIAAYAGRPIGNYFYTNRFFLCSTNQASITGRWAGDDSGDMRLNGGPASNFLPAGFAFASWTPVSITSGFVPGWNTLVFRITNSVWGSVTGLRTELRATACCNNCVTITCPPNRIVTNCPPGVAVAYSAPSATSGCGTIASVSCTPASGAFFPLGTNTVTCTAVDSAGNAATCSFTVTVRPAAGPVVIMCPPNQTIVTCANNAAAYYKVKAMGQAGPVVCNPPSGTTFPAGTNIVVCTATNICGQGVSCSFLVIVKPHLLGPPDLTLTAGLPDGFAQPPEASPPSACMITAFSGFSFWKGFDSNAANVLFGHRFAGLPNNIVKAELVVHMRPTSDGGAANDGIFMGLPTCLFSSFRYSASIAALPAAGGNWNPGHAATTFTFNLGVLNPLIISDLNVQQYFDVVVHDDTTVDYMQLRIWRCPPPSPGTGIPHTAVAGAVTALRPVAGPGISIPAICVFPNPNLPSGILLQPGAAQKVVFTTTLDFEVPEGAGIDLMLPADPRATNGMPFLSFHRKSGPKGYCVKTAKLYDDDPAISYRSSVVQTNGDLLSSIAWDAANIGTNVLAYINRLDGVTSVVMTVTLDLETFEATLEFPHCIWTEDSARKGWDGCIYGNGTPSKGTNKTARLILTPTPPVKPLAPVSELTLLATGLSEVLVEDPEIQTMGRKWGDGHVTLMKAYDDGETARLSFITMGEGGGVHTDLGHAATFSIGIHHFENGDAPTEEQLYRLIGPPPRGLTNRPTPPTFPLRLARGEGGVHCTVDFSDLAAESITVQLWRNGVLVGEGTGPGAAILPDSPLILDRWPARFGRPAVNTALIHLTASPEEPFTVSGIVGDELRFIPGLPPGMEMPAYISRLECETSEDMDSLLYDLQRTLACPPAPLTVIRSSTDIQISWTDDGYRLEGSEGVTGPWFELSDTSPVTLGANHRARYFRLICD